jgi:hypothetical protein
MAQIEEESITTESTENTERKRRRNHGEHGGHGGRKNGDRCGRFM